MKNYWKKSAAAAAVIVMALCAVLGSGIMAAAAVETKAAAAEETAKTEAAATYNDAGFYEMLTMSSGEDSMDFAEMKQYGIRSGLVLSEDGTGFMFIGKEMTDLTWRDGQLDVDGDVTQYKLSKGILTMEEEDEEMKITIRFEKSDDPVPTREDVAAWGDNYDFDSMLNDFVDTENWDVERETIIVDTVEDFMEAIGSNHTIVMMPGEYNITEWLDKGDAEKWNEKKYEKISTGNYDSEDLIDSGIYADSVFDGVQAVIYDVDDLVILSADKNDPARIVCEPRYAEVMSFIDCDRLSLRHVVLGHTEKEGYCTGDVLALTYCWDVSIEDSELYGCGAYALEVSNCMDVKVEDCDIHDCTYGIAVAADTNRIDFTHTDFHDCREFTMFEALSTDMMFIGCGFEKLEGELLTVGDTQSEVYFICCAFDKEAQASIDENKMLDQQIFVY